jgi:hypothetical protein
MKMGPQTDLRRPARAPTQPIVVPHENASCSMERKSGGFRPVNQEPLEFFWDAEQSRKVARRRDVVAED